MKKRSTLATLIRLAGEDKTKAAETLAQAVADQRRAEDTLDTLMGYLSDYRQTLEGKATAGTTALEMKNQHAFLTHLDRIIEKQKGLISATSRNVDNCRDEWRGHFRREKSFDLLNKRREASESIRQLKQEQKLLDEHATRHHHDKHHPKDHS